MDVIGYDEAKMEKVGLYVRTAAKMYMEALDATSNLIEGFESPLGMELLATVDWLIHYDRVEPRREAIKEGLRNWTGGEGAGTRKLKLFNDRMIDLALFRLDQTASATP